MLLKLFPYACFPLRFQGNMRTVHIAVIIFRLIVFTVDADTFYLVSVIVLAGNTVDTDTIQILYPIDLGFKFADGLCHVAVNGCAVLQGTVNNGRKFLAGHRTVTLELSIRIPFQKTSVCQ